MSHYDEDVQCKKCKQYLGTYNMIYSDKPDEKYLVCQDKKKCKERQEGRRKVRYW